MMELDARLYLVLTPDLCSQDPFDTLARALAGGVDLVQWRTPRPDPEGAAHCARICASFGVPWIVNDFLELAVAAGADGVHLGQEDDPPAGARRHIGPERTLGISTHDLDQARQAQAAGADYLGLGPCQPSETKGYRHGLPPGSLASVLEAIQIPVFAIGGISEKNLPGILEEGARRIAVGAAILRADDPEAAARRLRRLLD